MIHVTYQSINVLEPQMSWNWKRILLIVGRCDEQPSFPGDLLIQKNTTESEYFGPKNAPESRVFLDPKIPLSQGYFWKIRLRGIYRLTVGQSQKYP